MGDWESWNHFLITQTLIVPTASSGVVLLALLTEGKDVAVQEEMKECYFSKNSAHNTRTLN
jgi:hypothetical protein